MQAKLLNCVALPTTDLTPDAPLCRSVCRRRRNSSSTEDAQTFKALRASRFFQRGCRRELMSRCHSYGNSRKCHSCSRQACLLTTCHFEMSSKHRCMQPLGVCETSTLPAVLSLQDAVNSMQNVVQSLQLDPPIFESGILRFQVPFPPMSKALQWLQCIPQIPNLLPRVYFSQRGPRGDVNHHKKYMTNASCKEDVHVFQGVAGVGSAILFRGSEPFSFDDWKSIKRFLSKKSPLLRAYGSMRFDPDTNISSEWVPFGTFYFFIPQIEYCECGSFSMLAVNIAWDESCSWKVEQALQTLASALREVNNQSCSIKAKSCLSLIHKGHVPDEQVWHATIDGILNLFDIEVGKEKSNSHPYLLDPHLCHRGSISKVVLARQTKLVVDGHIDPISLLSGLQEKDPVAYQFCIQLPDLTTFFGSTPERLFARSGSFIATEAVAGTRPRGTTEMEDHGISMDLLLSPKDHEEFNIVHQTIKKHMKVICTDFKVDSYKSIIKQAKVQHLYAHFNAELKDESDEFKLLQALHPTPAVCGLPSQHAKAIIALAETFDRGMYAGPVGWFGGNQTEFAVGIRSALLERQGTAGRTLFLYAGVGIVKGANASSEWRELELKTSQFEALLKSAPSLRSIVNINALWATMIVEECSRLGITYFCIAPGSRSSPLAVAAAANPRISCVSCIDERSLAFHALGYGRGANKPAVVVTSSGTAVSNLYPAVVEASQDFVPMILLTADRPPELQDTGANQTIEQVRHFGSFIRYHVNLPPPDDQTPARMILTTVDVAVFRSTTIPSGPVHINCAFREPLAAVPEAWNADCLQGLQRWERGSVPFTKYIDCSFNLASHISSRARDLQEVGNLIEEAKRGLLILGGVHTVEETWAALKLSQHLGWPVFPDILSGLRLGKVFMFENDNERSNVIIYNFDHILLNKSVGTSILPDVILQIGGRITSKRLSNFLESCSPHAYILVEEHAFRSDPSHIISHRVKCSSVQFTSCILQAIEPGHISSFSLWLQQLSEVARKEIELHLQMETSLTEPFIAQAVTSSLPHSSALFLGNSMPIRDADMYANVHLFVGRSFMSLDSPSLLASQSIMVASNRGASGIDGVLSTAIGFAAGSRRRVTLLIGDISFLHDTNGLTLLKNRVGQPPVIVVVVNNHGGSIFSLLPIANTAPQEAFTSLFSTPHDISIEKLCRAHRVNYIHVSEKEELIEALSSIQQRNMNWVVEVEGDIEDNAAFHKYLQSQISQSLEQAFHILPNPLYVRLNEVSTQRKISSVDYRRYKVLLSSKTTTTMAHSNTNEKHGFLLMISLCDGSTGVGEIAPLRGLHKEDLLDTEYQLTFLKMKLQGVMLTATLPLLNGSFSEWLWQFSGIKPKYMLPSVRCGLEMAILDALSSSYKCNLVDLFVGRNLISEEKINQTEAMENLSLSMQDPAPASQICALLDSAGGPDDSAEVASKLVEIGFRTLKVKVARRASPLEDAAVVLAIRKKVGDSVILRADANRGWTLSQAMEFSNAVQTCNLQYIEEPLRNPHEIILFCRESHLPVALDETIDDYATDLDEFLSKYASPGVIALVLKPGLLGGFEKVNMLARKARKRGILAIVSSAFESSVSLKAYAQFSAFLDCMQATQVRSMETQLGLKPGNFSNPTVAHGLGTYMWLKTDVVGEKQKFSVKPTGFGMRVSSDLTAGSIWGHLDPSSVGPSIIRKKISTYILDVKSGIYKFRVFDTMTNVTKSMDAKPTLVFLHGFLGSGDDWIPIMHTLSISFRCIAVDLPGHGETKVDESKKSFFANPTKEDIWSFDAASDAISQLLASVTQSKVVLIGYSMGARLALYMALRRRSQQVSAAVLISGSPGLEDPQLQLQRCAEDDKWAEVLRSRGFPSFVELWYEQPLWKSLRLHPEFETIKRNRTRHEDVEALAKALSSLSVGRQPPLWEELNQSQIPLLLIVGKLDEKFVKIAKQMAFGESHSSSQSTKAACHEGEMSYATDTFSRIRQVQFLGSSKSAHHLQVEETPGDLRSDCVKDVSGDLGALAAYAFARIKQFEEEESGEHVECCDLTTQVVKRISSSSSSMMKVVEIEESGHAVHVENPLATIQALRDFVVGLDVSHVDHLGLL